ncbi:hypothetical protein HK405_007457 [Cladochytrium tenue]|nr:hypothetical protein HK405_007457 [Cladochytrium tenue]
MPSTPPTPPITPVVAPMLQKLQELPLQLGLPRPTLEKRLPCRPPPTPAATTSAAAWLPAEVLSRIAFFGVTRGAVADALSAGAHSSSSPNRPRFADVGAKNLCTVRATECRGLAERRRVSLAWCAAMTPPLFFLVDFGEWDSRQLAVPARYMALLRALLPATSADDGPDDFDGGVGSGDGGEGWRRSNRLPRLSDLVQVLRIGSSPPLSFQRLLKRLVLPRLHSMYICAHANLDLLSFLPQPHSVTFLSLDIVRDWSDKNGHIYSLEKVVKYLGRLPGLVNLELTAPDVEVIVPCSQVDMTLQRLAGLHVRGRGLLKALARSHILVPHNVKWFSGLGLDDDDLSVLVEQFNGLTHSSDYSTWLKAADWL